MKKSLSLLVAIAMVFSMFATVVSAADEKTPGQYLNELGVILGNQDGDLKEGQTWKRQDVAVLLSRLVGAEDEAKGAEKTHEFTDVTDENYDGYISWAVEEGLFEGKGDGKFGFGAELKTQELYALILRVLGVDTSGANYANVPELAIEHGFATEDTDFTAVPKRGDTYVVVVAALKTEVAPGVTLEQKLGLVKVADAVASASAVGVKKVEVKFNAPVDTAKASFAVKKGSAISNVSKITFNDAKTVATLETSVALSAGDYTVTVSGLGLAAGKDAASFSVTPERIESVSVDDNGYRTAVVGTAGSTTVEVAIKLLNQYGEEVSAGVAGSVYGTSTVGTANVSSDNKKVTITNVADTIGTLNLTVVDAKFAKSTTKAITVQLFKAISEVELGTVEIPANKTSIEADTTVVLPYTAKDQYGNALTLDSLAGLTFIPSDGGLITNIALTTDKKKLQFKLEDFNGPKTFTIQVIVNASGKSSKVEFSATGKKNINNVTLVASTGQFGKGENAYEVEVQAVDQYGNALTADEIIARQGELVVTAGNPGVFAATNAVTPISKSGDKAVIKLTGVDKGTAILIVSVKSNAFNTNISLTVVDAKYAASLAIKTDVTKAVYQANITLKAEFTDQYGGAFTAGTDAVVVVSSDNTDFGGAVANQTVTALKGTGIVRTAGGHDKTTVVTFKLYDNVAHANANGTEGLLDTASVTLTSVKADAVLTYEIDDLGTIAAKAAPAGGVAGKYAKEIKVSGKDSSGAKVALKSNAISEVTAADSSILTVSGTTIAAVADKEGDTSVNVYIAKHGGGVEVKTAPVKISKAASVVTSITGKKGDDEVTKVTVAVNTTITGLFTKATNPLWFEVKDQYGVAADNTVNGNGPTTSVFITDEAGAVTVNNTGNVTFDAVGTWKVTVASGSQSKTVEVTVQ